MDVKIKKTISWTALAATVSTVTYFAVTRDPKVLPASILLNGVIYPVGYYVHEKLWGRHTGG